MNRLRLLASGLLLMTSVVGCTSDTEVPSETPVEAPAETPVEAPAETPTAGGAADEGSDSKKQGSDTK